MGVLLILFFVFFVWLLVDPFTAWISGWTRLAKQYRAAGKAPVQTFRSQIGLVGCMPYNCCLTVGIDRQGIFLAMPRHLFVAHPALFIPWRDIKSIRHGVRVFCNYGFSSFWSSGVFKEYTELSVTGPPPTRVLLPSNTLPPRIQEACLQAQRTFQATHPDEEIRSVGLEAVEEDRFVVSVLYGYRPMMHECYTVDRATTVATQTPVAVDGDQSSDKTSTS